MRDAGNNTSKAFAPSWDSQGTPGSSLLQLAPSHTRHQTGAEGRGPQGSHSLSGWEPPPFEQDANYNGPHARLSPAKNRLCCALLSAGAAEFGEIMLFLALVLVGDD